MLSSSRVVRIDGVGRRHDDVGVDVGVVVVVDVVGVVS